MNFSSTSSTFSKSYLPLMTAFSFLSTLLDAPSSSPKNLIGSDDEVVVRLLLDCCIFDDEESDDHFW